MHKASDYIFDAIQKKHSIPIAIAGLFLSVLSAFEVKLGAPFSGYTFWAVVIIIAGVALFIFLGLKLAISEVNRLRGSRFSVGNLPEVIQIKKNTEDDGALLILKDSVSIHIDKDTVVSISYLDDESGEMEVALGVVIKQQDDNKIIIAANPKTDQLALWKSELIRNCVNWRKIKVSTCINRNYLDSDYLYKENYDIQVLTKAAKDLDADAEGNKL